MTTHCGTCGSWSTVGPVVHYSWCARKTVTPEPAQALGWQCPWCPHQVITIVGSSPTLADRAQADAIREHTASHTGGDSGRC